MTLYKSQKYDLPGRMIRNLMECFRTGSSCELTNIRDLKTERVTLENEKQQFRDLMEKEKVEFRAEMETGKKEFQEGNKS